MNIKKEKNLSWAQKNPEKSKAIKKRYYDSHRKELNAKNKIYREKNPDKIKSYYEENKEVILANGKKYREENPEKRLASRKLDYERHKERYKNNANEWYKQNLDQARKVRRDYYRLHREEILQYQKEYIQKHPEIPKLTGNKRRAQKLGTQTEKITQDIWNNIKSLYGNRCVYCGRILNRLQMDHVIPLIHGGSHTKNNIVPSCQKCNFTKHTNKAPIFQPILLELVAS